MEKTSAGEKFYRGLSWLLAIAVAGTIFYFSSQKGTDSTRSSTAVTSLFYMALHGGKELTDLILLELLDVIVRAVAHVVEYMIFSFSVGLLSSSYRIRGQIRSFYMVFAGFALSVADEALQTFVPGRYGDLSDIVADTMGASFVAFLFYVTWKKRNGKLHAEKGSGRRAFMRIAVDDIGEAAALDRIMEYAADKNGRHFIVTPNADHIIQLEKDEAFLAAYKDADLIVPDGTPLLWIAASTGHPMKERVTGADLFERVCRRAAEEKRSVFFLGGFKEAAERASKAMAKKYHGLKIAGAVSPDPGFDTDETKTEELITAINSSKPDILLFCIGAPRSEIFLHRYRERMHFGVALPFGTAIDFAAGEVKRAPLWMQKTGMEWFYRFLQEPGRLFRRYFIEDIQIFRLVLKYRRMLIAGEGAEAQTDGASKEGKADGHADRG